MAWASSHLAYTPSRLDLYSKSFKGNTLCLKVPPPPYYSFLEASRIEVDTFIYNQGLNLRLNCTLKDYVHNTVPAIYDDKKEKSIKPTNKIQRLFFKMVTTLHLGRVELPEAKTQ
jgi:hypothetical protein